MTHSGSDDWSRISSLFYELVALNPLERAARLDEIRKESDELAASVQALIDADAEAEEQLAKFEFGLSDVVRRSPSLSSDTLANPRDYAGRTISHFEIIDYLASGGMGVVYRARDLRLNRIVALKFPLPHQQLDSTVRERFLREARAAGSLEHVNLCTVLEAGDSEEGLYLAMPLYSGETLKDRLSRQKRIAPGEALAMGEQIASGLQHAHEAGIVHRDLKPGNVMILPDGTVKILDFGLAKIVDISNTKSGVTLGTVSYMAPEQIRSKSADARTDLWSLGVLLYEMLGGTRPFQGEHEVSIANAILTQEPRSLGTLGAGISRPVQSLVATLLQKDPRNRYQNAADLKADIARLRQGMPALYRPAFRPLAGAWLHKRRIPIALVATAIAVAAIVIFAPAVSSELNKPTENDEAYQFYLRGRSYEQSGPMAAAESLYKRALALDTGFALARARLAIVYAACLPGGSRDCARINAADQLRDRTDDVRTAALAALKRDPDLSDAHLAMGLYWERRSQPDSALKEFIIARKGLDKSGELHAGIGRAYRDKGEWSLAIKELERAIKLDPTDASPMVDLATTLSRLRRYEEAIQYWNRYIAVTPDAYLGMVIKGNAYLRWLGTVDSLDAIYRQLPPQEKGFITGVLIARLRGRYDEALEILARVPKPRPEDLVTFNIAPLQRAEVYMDLGDSLHARMNFDSARVILERVVAGKPDNYAAHLSLGLAYAGLGRFDDAVREANRGMELVPPSRTVLLGTTAMSRAAEIFAYIPQQRTRAIQLLDSLMQMPAGREVSAAFLRVYPSWKKLRSEPEFQKLLAKYP